MSQDGFRERIGASVTEVAGASEDCEFCRWMAGRSWYLSGDLLDRNIHAQFQPLLAQMDQKYRTCGNYLFYFAYGDQISSET